jgi:muramidase (phage lysozyme)
MTVAFKDFDPATDTLLDFIAGGHPDNPMGESAGNYDAIYGDIDGNCILAEKTLSDIYAMQTDMVNQNGISSATGRYQALKATLQEYQSKAGLNSNELFTEILQDQFGLQKLVDRGYQSWWSQSISDEEFMYRLSCEWASLPDPRNDGKSHYDGDSAGNHASTDLVSFQNVLDTCRNYINGMPAPETKAPRLTADEGIRAIQRVLVMTGDLTTADIDGEWGPTTQEALDELIERD